MTITVKLVHVVTTAEWAQVSPTERHLKKVRERHAIAATLRFDSGLGSIAFPGFTQGNATPADQRISYEKIARDVANLIYKTFGIALLGLSVRPQLEILLNAATAEVIDRGRSVHQTRGGSLMVSCHGTSDDTSELLSKLLKDKINPADVRTALREATADVVWLYWSSLKVDTKLTLSEFAPSLLFLWRRGGASSAHLEYVLGRLTPQANDHLDGIRNAEEYLNSASPGKMIRVSDLMQRFGLTQDETLGILTPMVTNDRFALRFRVRSNKQLLDYANMWSIALDRLPVSVTDEDEQEISLMDASNIEVGYERIG